MGGRGGSGRSVAAQGPAASNATAPDSDELVLREAFAQALTRSNSDQWVEVSTLRDMLAARGWSREKQEAEILKFVRARKGVLAPQSTQGFLTAKNRRDAIQMGNQDKHLFSIED
jgi:hypothetical protein